VLKERGLNVRKLDRRVEIGSTEAIKSLVMAEIGVAFFSCWEIQNELAAGTLRELTIPGFANSQSVFLGASPVGIWAVFPASFIDSPILSETRSLPLASEDGRDSARPKRSQCQRATASPKDNALHVRGHSIAAGAIARSAIRLNHISKSWTRFSIRSSQASVSFFLASSVRAAIAWSESRS
jgi:LysR substrate binding domain